MDPFYPVVWLGTGGSLGNSLFFLMSGYGLAKSARLQGTLRPWLIRRLGRIMPTVWLTTLPVLLVGLAFGSDFAQGSWLAALVYPTHYWFVGAILAFYLPFFFLVRGRDARVIWSAIAALAVLYAVWYWQVLDDTRFFVDEGGGYLRWVYYGAVMLLGSLVATTRLERFFLWRRAWTVVLWGLLYVALKVIFLLGIGLEFQWTVHLVAPSLSLAIFAQREAISAAIEKLGAKTSLLAVLLGQATLEAYAIQVQILRVGTDSLKGLGFPRGMLAFLIILAAGTVVVRLARGGLGHIALGPPALQPAESAHRVDS
jgi:peptidoglycan/LPS O-acetylase OafA/YrhL